MSRSSAFSVSPVAAGIHLPAVGVLTAWLVLLAEDGGYFARDWMVAALAFIALLVMLAVAGRRFEGSTPLALAVFGGFVLWSFASLLWADSPSRALESSDQLLAYLLCSAVLAAIPWRVQTATALMAAFSGGAALVLLVGLLSAAGDTELSEYFVESRWDEPLGYPNGAAAAALIPAIAALVISARPDLHVAARTAAFTITCLLAGIAMLPQSRGSVIGAAVAIAVAVAVVPFRWRLAARVAVLAILALVLSDAVFGVYTAGVEERPVGPALDDAVRAILLGTLGGGVAGALLALGESRVVLGEAGQRRSRQAGIAVLAVAVMAVAGVTAAKWDRVSSEISDQWDALASPGNDATEEEDEDAGGSRLLSTDPVTRYDFVRVSREAFLDAPVHGIGSGNFGPLYTAERRYKTPSEFPHNVILRPLVETGIVGSLLLLGFALVLLRALLGGVRAATAPARGVIAAALAMLGYLMAHGQFDWLEEFPALAMPVMGFLFVAVVVRHREIPASPLADRARTAPLPAAAYVGGGALALLAFAVTALPLAAIRYQDRANRLWRTDTQAAYRQLDRAAAANPLSPTPHVIEGLIATQVREYPRARAAFREALDREPAWLPRFELGLLAAVDGDREEALRQFAIAGRLNAIEPAIDEAEEAVRKGERVDPRASTSRLFDKALFRRRSIR